MTDTGATRIATVCARGGSTGVPGKNLLELAGEPLVGRAVRQAREAGIFTVITVSSDDPHILDIGQRAGADFIVQRPFHFASDEAGKLGAILHAVETTEAERNGRFDTVVDLDVTTPLRSPRDIIEVVEQLETTEATIVLTASRTRRSPYFNLVQIDEEGVPSLPCPDNMVARRQDGPPLFDLSGAVYAWTRAALDVGELFTRTTRLYLLPWQRAWDIDEPTDVDIIRFFSSSEQPGEA